MSQCRAVGDGLKCMISKSFILLCIAGLGTKSFVAHWKMDQWYCHLRLFKM